MRCADLGPTPGRQRSASISSSSAVGDFMSEKSSERQLHPRRQAQTARQPGHLLLHRGLDLAYGVVDRCRHEVFEHLLVVGKQGRIDADPLDVAPAGHCHPDHARARLALDLDRGELLLELAHVFLHLLGLPHQPRKLFLHRRSLRHRAGLIEDSTMVASKFSTRSRTNASWLIAEAARSRALLPVVSLIVTARRTGLPKRSCNAPRSLSWKFFSARCFAEGGTRSSSVSPSKDLSSLTWASCFAIPPRSSELASFGQSPSNAPWAACGSPTRFSVSGRSLPAGPLRPSSPAPRIPGAKASMRSSAMVKPANSSGANGRSCRPWIAI